MASSKKEFFKKLKIGKMGEDVVLQKLAGRIHWNSPKPPIKKGHVIINPELIVCPAQKWTDTSEERKLYVSTERKKL